jgi:hypothetical protein
MEKNNMDRRIGFFVASALPTSGQSNLDLIMTSSNGIDWNVRNVPQSNEWYG